MRSDQIKSVSISNLEKHTFIMVPTPVNWNSIQPFKAVRDNWSSLQPYHDNIVTTISFATILTAFIGTASVMIKHGFKFPRLHPSMEVEELEPSPELLHPNEYITEEALTEVKVFEFAMEDKWRKAKEQWESQERKTEEELGSGVVDGDANDENSETREAAEEVFQETAETGVDNAMDNLDDAGAFDIQTEAMLVAPQITGKKEGGTVQE
jgi:hypothetical protein